MARVFDTTFSYRGAPYTAVVTISNADEKRICIEVPDTSLHAVLPGGKIIFERETVRPKDPSDSHIDPELIKSIQEAVETHEKNKPKVNLWS